MRNLLFSILLLGFAAVAHAQSTDVALLGGGYFAASSPLDLGLAWALEGTVAHKVVGVPFAAVSAELPIAGSFTSSIPTLSGTSIARSYTSLFITPGVRVQLAPSFPISPYFSAGLGYGRFNRQFVDGTTSSDGTFAFDIGGGLDLKVLPFISLRAEVRDFNSGGIGLQSLALGRQNNIFVTAGVALRF